MSRANHEKLYDIAMQAIRDLFSDKDVSQGEARADLQALKDEIDILMESLDEDGPT